LTAERASVSAGGHSGPIGNAGVESVAGRCGSAAVGEGGGAPRLTQLRRDGCDGCDGAGVTVSGRAPQLRGKRVAGDDFGSETAEIRQCGENRLPCQVSGGLEPADEHGANGSNPLWTSRSGPDRPSKPAGMRPISERIDRRAQNHILVYTGMGRKVPSSVSRPGCGRRPKPPGTRSARRRRANVPLTRRAPCGRRGRSTGKVGGGRAEQGTDSISTISRYKYPPEGRAFRLRCGHSVRGRRGRPAAIVDACRVSRVPDGIRQVRVCPTVFWRR
jgi:hypothetical protein